MFFDKYVLQYCMISGWLNLQMWKPGYRRLTLKLYADFWQCVGPHTHPYVVQRSNVVRSDLSFICSFSPFLCHGDKRIDFVSDLVELTLWLGRFHSFWCIIHDYLNIFKHHSLPWLRTIIVNITVSLFVNNKVVSIFFIK